MKILNQHLRAASWICCLKQSRGDAGRCCPVALFSDAFVHSHVCAGLACPAEPCAPLLLEKIEGWGPVRPKPSDSKAGVHELQATYSQASVLVTVSTWTP